MMTTEDCAHGCFRRGTQDERKELRQIMRGHAKGNKDSYFMGVRMLRWHAHLTNYWYFN